MWGHFADQNSYASYFSSLGDFGTQGWSGGIN